MVGRLLLTSSVHAAALIHPNVLKNLDLIMCRSAALQRGPAPLQHRHLLWDVSHRWMSPLESSAVILNTQDDGALFQVNMAEADTRWRVQVPLTWPPS